MDEWTSHSEEIVHDHLLLKVSRGGAWKSMRDMTAVVREGAGDARKGPSFATYSSIALPRGRVMYK